MSARNIGQSTSELTKKLNFQSVCYRFALAITIFAFCVAVLGAYTRLTDAGLGCPDWPGCYGQLILTKNFQIDNPGITDFNAKKAWTEMAHRYLAGFLGLLIFILMFKIFSLRKEVFFKVHKSPLRLSLAVVALVIFQALLGMWTVTLKLLPGIVMAHLLGGFTMLSLLYWLTLKLSPAQYAATIISRPHEKQLKLNDLLNETHAKTANQPDTASATKQTISLIKIWSIAALIILILQIFLGGWTSANYAALVCLDFPACFAGQYFPTDLNLAQAFNLFGERNTASITIHMTHRFAALLTAITLYGLCFYTYRHIQLLTVRKITLSISALLSLQILLGMMNVLALLPLAIAIAHHAVAALLLLGLVNFIYAIYSPAIAAAYRNKNETNLNVKLSTAHDYKPSLAD